MASFIADVSILYLPITNPVSLWGRPMAFLTGVFLMAGHVRGQSHCPLFFFFQDCPVCRFFCCRRWVDFFRGGTRETQTGGMEGRRETDTGNWLHLEGKARCMLSVLYSQSLAQHIWHRVGISSFSACASSVPVTLGALLTAAEDFPCTWHCYSYPRRDLSNVSPWIFTISSFPCCSGTFLHQSPYLFSVFLVSASFPLANTYTDIQRSSVFKRKRNFPWFLCLLLPSFPSQQTSI